MSLFFFDGAPITMEIFEVNSFSSSIASSIFFIKSDLKTKSSGGYPQRNISLKITKSMPFSSAFITSSLAFKRFPEISPTIGFS